MQLLEGLLFPIPGVIRVEADIPVTKAAEVLQAEYAARGTPVVLNGNIDEFAERVAALDNPSLAQLLRNPKLAWHLEKWPIRFLRMTQMKPPEADDHIVNDIILGNGRRFGGFAEAVKQYPQLLASDLGYCRQSERDRLPLLGIRGIFHNHITDGHHRTILALWDGRVSMDVLTAYKRCV